MSSADAAITAEITRLIERNFDAFRNDETFNADRVNHPDATIWDVFTPELIRGDAARRKFHDADHAQMRARGKLTLNVENMLVDTWDDTALARYHVYFHYEPPNPASGRIRITDVFRKFDGRWLRVHHHEGMMPTGVPPITEAKS